MNVIDDAAVGPYERVVHAEDPRSGLRAIVAVHSTALGPAVGGTRFHPYASEASATIDVLRLAEGMTLKAAAAGLALGGGKAVILGDPDRLRSPALWRAYAEVVDLFGGRYHTAEDVGTTPADMAALRAHTPFVLGLPDGRGGWDGDPSPYTARGVLAAMRAAWESETGAPGLEGVRVVVEGAGKVGGALALLLAADGAQVMVTDIRTERAVAIAARAGGRALDPAIASAQPCDILAPCALGGGLTHESVARLRCRWVIGSANNQLSDDGVAEELREAGIGYVPDFVANAGGLICVAQELEGWDPDRAGTAADGIGDVVRELIAAADAAGGTLLEAAHHRAAGRLAPAAAR
jgi:glutamate dehydrogenase/leucine dehydrogenase